MSSLVPTSGPCSAIERLNPLDDAKWDARLEPFADATFFHTKGWMAVLHSTYGFSPMYFGAMAGEQLRGLIPMAEVRSVVTGKRGIGLPFTDESPPLVHSQSDFEQLWQETVRTAKERGWRYIECRGGKTRFPEANASITFWRHTLDLQRSETELFAACSKATRGAVRQAEKHGVTVEVSNDLASVRAFYVLLARTRKRHGLPVQPFSLFRNIYRHVLAVGNGCVILARFQGKPVAGGVFFHFRKSVLYKFGASDEAYQHVRGSNLVIWTAIKRFAAKGFEKLDFGRTSLLNEGLRKFKLSWGVQEDSLEYVRYAPKDGRYVFSGDDSAGWHSRIFRLLPVPLLRLAGTLMYRHAA